MAADARDLTTVASLKTWMGTTATTADGDLQRLVTATSVWIQNWLSRNIASQSYTDTRDGLGNESTLLRNWPVTAVASVVIDGQTIPASGYVLANDAVVLRGYRFNRGAANVVITYTAGYAATPPDLEQACIELCAFKWKERDRIGHSSLSAGGQQTNFIVRDMPPGVLSILNQWRKVIEC